MFAFYCFTIDLEDAADNLDGITGQSDNTLNVVAAVVARQFKHDDVAALSLGK